MEEIGVFTEEAEIEAQIEQMLNSNSPQLAAVGRLYKSVRKLCTNWFEAEIKNVCKIKDRDEKREAYHKMIHAAVTGHVGLMVATIVPQAASGHEVKAIETLKELLIDEFDNLLESARKTDFSAHRETRH